MILEMINKKAIWKNKILKATARLPVEVIRAVHQARDVNFLLEVIKIKRVIPKWTTQQKVQNQGQKRDNNSTGRLQVLYNRLSLISYLRGLLITKVLPDTK